MDHAATPPPGTGDPEEVAEDKPLRLGSFLPYRLSVAAEAVSRAFAARYEAEFHLGIPEWRIMAVLGEAGTLTTQEVIRRTEMDRVKVSRAVIRLADKRLLARAPLPEDLRAHRLRLTAQGTALYARIVPRARALQAELAEVLTARELAELSAILAKVHDRAAALLRRREEGEGHQDGREDGEAER
ncbi:MarR family winged helix-turn-helix transcriptional regulator [Roseomonas sp. OT10]|uniref:MarR family winged helix-turn-helix transcriptional regulator n=1 Tax=Roseomonas cutis TaxID=2897332 RepID=UPI001E3860F2|nr:MarR family winged helix-turn-helix transcriptional regulator [Roseomonas sp. OT10]UFN49908.1 MarR family winged helix-turn-helix transcriptional regulator [Roseomonas sp. OT10]